MVGMDFDIMERVGMIDREVETGDRDGAPVRRVVASRTYPAPPADVWEALTDPERIPRWFLPITGELKLGGRYQLEGNAGGTIEACDPPRHLGLTWEFDGQKSWVLVDLAEASDGTHLRLEHTVPVDGHWEEFGPGATGVGWEMALLGLDVYVLDLPGKPSDLMESPLLPDYMKASSQAWHVANVAGGAPEAEARAQADRTTAAYTAPPEEPEAAADAGAEAGSETKDG